MYGIIALLILKYNMRFESIGISFLRLLSAFCYKYIEFKENLKKNKPYFQK